MQLMKERTSNDNKQVFTKGLGEFKEILTQEKTKLKKEVTTLHLDNEDLKFKIKQIEYKA